MPAEFSASFATRFAPSPTGRLHLGHAFSAVVGWRQARRAGGRFLLRLEDLDGGRCRESYVDGILADLTWLGVDWDEPVVRQSDRLDLYQQGLETLWNRGIVYRCICTRRDIAAAIEAPQEGGMIGPDGPVYPGTCRDAGHGMETPHALRLNLAGAIDALGGPSAVSGLGFEETAPPARRVSLDPQDLLTGTGDIVLRRRDGAPAYHLAVVIDDADQGVTCVTRGQDLAPAAPIQRLLQSLLALPEVAYHHHRLIRDDEGRRLAKRHDALSLAALQEAGATPAEILRRLGL